MEWDEYKSLCDRPFTFSRWMLEQTIALVRDETHLADTLATALRGPVLAKPIDHKGGPEADMFEVRIEVAQAQAIHCLVRAAATSGQRLTTRPRGLGGFDAAWRECVNFLERETQLTGSDK